MQKIGLLRKPAVSLLLLLIVWGCVIELTDFSSRMHRLFGLACCTGAGCDLLGVGSGGLAAARARPHAHGLVGRVPRRDLVHGDGPIGQLQGFV